MTKTVLQDSDGQLYLQFTEQELNQVGWDIGDEIIWEENENGYTITKQN